MYQPTRVITSQIEVNANTTETVPTCMYTRNEDSIYGHFQKPTSLKQKMMNKRRIAKLQIFIAQQIKQERTKWNYKDIPNYCKYQNKK